MFEILLAIAAIVTIARIASADDQSPILWGAAAFFLIGLCIVFVPLAYGRVLLGGILTFVGMTAYKMAARK